MARVSSLAWWTCVRPNSDTVLTVIPVMRALLRTGAGGTQRLTHAIGKSKAMELVLTGGKIDAKAAEKAGLVARIYPAEELVDEVVKVADKIAQLSTPIVMMAKEGVNKSFEMSLQEGLNYERLMFHSTFATVGLALGRKNPLPRSPPPLNFTARSLTQHCIHPWASLSVGGPCRGYGCVRGEADGRFQEQIDLMPNRTFPNACAPKRPLLSPTHTLDK